MQAIILIIWTATTAGSAYYINESGWMEVGQYASVDACIKAAEKQNAPKFKCITKK